MYDEIEVGYNMINYMRMNKVAPNEINLWHVYPYPMTVIEQLRQPEYTGNNRCTPCTVVNVIIATIVSALAALGSAFLGASVFALSLVTIYLRGYLVPGTPTLTKRYFPERVLRWFDKDTTTPVADKTVAIDSERVLLDASAIRPCREDTDFCLTPVFREAWRERIQTIRIHDLDKNSLKSALGIPPGNNRITIDQHGDAFVAHTDDTVIGQWSSQATVVADVTAAPELGERYSDWADLAPSEIAHVLISLRIFIEQCPECDGPVQVEQEIVESCCRSYDVIVSACQDYDTCLFEMEWDETVADDVPQQPN